MKYLKLYEDDLFDDYEQDFEEENWTQVKNKIEIDNVVYNVDNISNYSFLYQLEISNSKDEFTIIIGESSKIVGRVARRQMEELGQDELTEIIGVDTLVELAFG